MGRPDGMVDVHLDDDAAGGREGHTRTDRSERADRSAVGRSARPTTPLRRARRARGLALVAASVLA
ncbi:hypothetical protein ICW40_20535, partial [Actinotalea ferrariae]|uniref:hypothetical protein n=1 Tax=Actinotalea ferrariae TaxID=1386098 RepID=UPI001C8BD42D